MYIYIYTYAYIYIYAYMYTYILSDFAKQTCSLWNQQAKIERSMLCLAFLSVATHEYSCLCSANPKMVGYLFLVPLKPPTTEEGLLSKKRSIVPAPWPLASSSHFPSPQKSWSESNKNKRSDARSPPSQARPQGSHPPWQTSRSADLWVTMAVVALWLPPQATVRPSPRPCERTCRWQSKRKQPCSPHLTLSIDCCRAVARSNPLL